MLTPLQQSEIEWETHTTLHQKKHQISKFRPVFHSHDFRQYEQAIALLNWAEDSIQIEKLEKLPGASRGAAIPVVDYLKTLADKFQIHLSCHVKPYKPDPPWPDNERIASQEELEGWYKKRGFQLLLQEKPAPIWAWYPDIPSIYKDHGSGSLSVI